MDSVNKTLYIPLYGKTFVSKKGVILQDRKAEEIWEKEGFPLKGKSKSKWLAYYLGIRGAVFDSWLKNKMSEYNDSVVIHIGCGLDSRVLRVGSGMHKWYDVDFPEVIDERRKYFCENGNYRMLPYDIRKNDWLDDIGETKEALVVMEGISMYLENGELKRILSQINSHFEKTIILIDCYTPFAAKMSRYKNPINDVGVSQVYGIKSPDIFETEDLRFIEEHNMTPESYIEELTGLEKAVFKKLYAGSFSKKLYKLYEYESTKKGS